ncbi:MAG: hypothetical protein WCK73_06525, partial [Deltaproteobacteria bacterium]
MDPESDPRLVVRSTLRHPERLAVVLLLAVATVATAILAVPGPLPEMPGEEALGQPAPTTIRATRDLAVPDEDGTRRRRDEAAGEEPRVFDHDQGAAA